MEEIRDKDMIELIYQAEEKVLDERIKKMNKKLQEKIKDIKIEQLIENTSNSKELKKELENIEENYSIKIAGYNKEFYKQGFIDGVNLIINCLKK